MKHCQLISSTTFSSQTDIEKTLVELYDLTLVSIRELFTNKLRNESESELAIDIKKHLDNGKLVPTELITKLIEEKIKGLTSDILISGYPRTKEQFVALNKLLQENKIEINKLWLFELQNVDKLISERIHQDASEQIIEKFKQTINQNKELEKLINNPKIISKIGFDYPVNWTSEQMTNKIKAVYNKI
ncbi:nucleoside monophosphate kinase [Kordia zhangzhouensis]|uniref:nucleoside monophosphate kinase n=1 Tax=Kordia zhangzhouensis TaxID=1620405 RepID=UPI0006291D06|nr:nucleoside monophosphate kinase [Kordia zhangzhouensis]